MAQVPDFPRSPTTVGFTINLSCSSIVQLAHHHLLRNHHLKKGKTWESHKVEKPIDVCTFFLHNPTPPEYFQHEGLPKRYLPMQMTRPPYKICNWDNIATVEPALKKYPIQCTRYALRSLVKT